MDLPSLQQFFEYSCDFRLWLATYRNVKGTQDRFPLRPFMLIKKKLIQYLMSSIAWLRILFIRPIHSIWRCISALGKFSGSAYAVDFRYQQERSQKLYQKEQMWYNESMIQKNERRRYASDLSDSQCAIIEPLFPRAGNSSKWEKRELVNAVLYFVDNGCK